MTERTDFPYPVRVIENLVSPMPDGIGLRAKLWIPEGAGPVPAIPEYLPYRKREGTRACEMQYILITQTSEGSARYQITDAYPGSAVRVTEYNFDVIHFIPDTERAVAENGAKIFHRQWHKRILHDMA